VRSAAAANLAILMDRLAVLMGVQLSPQRVCRWMLKHKRLSGKTEDKGRWKQQAGLGRIDRPASCV
jgi:hypothetical protein